ncbi:MAG: Molybdenum cofactor biosynthesis protein MoaA [Candidatus Ozemobacter sibiricus]|uniref:Molybdenum cofactor biosynthesis protein MoaA n=1 Tax=Candidatus Ozemobacter sibiricus TaxID=2268124 RepID=A0A367ZSJ9_9BACT|nr:MAG: Molybdenum cofactor biosynthesis protein MoaA [Candidatus Ozemobacter sibiricus]
MRPDRPYTYLSTTTGMCRACRDLVTARLIERGGAVFQQNLCPRCGLSEALVAEDFAWYARTLATVVRLHPPRQEGHPVQLGCPHDCGPCAFHAGTCHLPVFSITNACELACPICFTFNRPDRLYHMEREELAVLLDRLLARTGPVDLINLTGGEPFLHPRLFDLIAEATARPEIGRITVNTNGLRLAREPDLARRLADLGAYVILSFDTFEPATSIRIHGRDLVAAKRQALDALQAAGVGVTLLHVLIPGLNEREFGPLLDLALATPVVRSITVQTMTYTGAGGGAFAPRTHLPLDRAARLIEEATGGRLRRAFFRPLPTAHPLCYQIAYAFKAGDRLFDFGEVFSPDEFERLLGPGYLMRPTDDTADLFQDALNRLWARNGDPALLASFRRTIDALFPPSGPRLTPAQRQKIGEAQVLTVYLHAHMDEDNFDVARVSTCPDQVPDSAGRLIPACAYNLFYRRQDPRFWHGKDAPS